MKLSEYLDKEKIHPIKMASDTGISLATIYNWISGKSKPNLDNLQKIEKFTNKKVTSKDFYE